MLGGDPVYCSGADDVVGSLGGLFALLRMTCTNRGEAVVKSVCGQAASGEWSGIAACWTRGPLYCIGADDVVRSFGGLAPSSG